MNAGPSARREAWFDVLVAAAFWAVSALLIAETIETPRMRIIAGAITLAHSGALVVRRRHPVSVIVVMAATAALTVPLGLPLIVVGPAIVAGVYTLGVRTAPPTARYALAGVIVVMAGLVLENGGDYGTIVSNSASLALAWWLGDRSRRSALANDAARVAAVDEARRAVVDERMRIARELHDVVAHSMTVIAVQAGAARYATPASLPDTAEAFAAIERTSRSALDEMRRLLTVLREEDSVSDLSPTPRLEDIDALVSSAAKAGVHVVVESRDVPAALPAGVELCAYRIVQEALTNVCKHAEASSATVVFTYGPVGLSIEVSDDGVGPKRNSEGGHGLVGMRERVSLYGGTFDAGASPRGGFRVSATLPVGAPQ